MFERFQQGTAGRRTTTGSGLGLYLCRQIITAHGGTIGVVDKPSPGATVRIVLPRQLILA
jgi:signal transduction histidine kinase